MGLKSLIWDELFLAMTFFLLLTAFLAWPLSLYQWDAPVAQIGDTVITRGDIFYTFKLLSLGMFMATFVLLVRKRLKRRGDENP